MGLTAAHSPSKDVTSSSAVATAQTATDSSVSPDLVCDPGVIRPASWAYLDPVQSGVSSLLTLVGGADPAARTIAAERKQVRVSHDSLGVPDSCGNSHLVGNSSGPAFDVAGGTFGYAVVGFAAYVD
jgi:hypothetical protein